MNTVVQVPKLEDTVTLPQGQAALPRGVLVSKAGAGECSVGGVHRNVCPSVDTGLP